MSHDLRALAAEFQIPGDFQGATPYGSGHINDTFAATFDQAGTPVRYIFQRINPHVFQQPVALMENIVRVTRHVRERLLAAGATQVSRRGLTLVPTHEGRAWHTDAAGHVWRGYLFIEGAQTYDQIESPAQARAAARAFGEFQTLLADLPAPRLHDTVPHFHCTRRRFDAFAAAVASDPLNRAAEVRAEIEFAQRREALVDALPREQAAGLLPERVTHNDTKLNNVLLDDATGEGICVLDLDTVMPGLALFDFGDMCRSACRPTLEDERDLARVEARMDIFAALVAGYLSAAGTCLNPTEVARLAFSARLITLETGLRFLTDFLTGDRYFKTRRPGQNADRARVQLRLLASFEQQAEAMERIVAEATGRA